MKIAAPIWVLVAPLCISAVHATTRGVPAPYPTIQSAIDAAVNDDTVLVTPGTYRESIDFKGKAIVVLGEAGADSTTIRADGTQWVVRFASGENLDSQLIGFTITEGRGGILCSLAHPTISRCTIRDNDFSPGGGGGFQCGYSQATITDCIIEDNIAARGGGIFCTTSRLSIQRCTIQRNVANGYESELGGSGGGIYCNGVSYPIIRNCVIADNEAQGPNSSGAGLYCIDTSYPWMENCLIVHNKITGLYGDGAGLACRYKCYPFLWNCTIADNAIVAQNDTATAGGIYSVEDSNPTIRNCIVWGNDRAQISDADPFGDVIVRYSDVEGGWPGEGNINLNPLFMTLQCFEYVLRPGSPCVDTGDPSLLDCLYDWHPQWPDGYLDGVRSDMGASGGRHNCGWKGFVCAPSALALLPDSYAGQVFRRRP